MKFMNEFDFTYVGDIEPTNRHIKIWVDTGHTNQE